MQVRKPLAASRCLLLAFRARGPPAGAKRKQREAASGLPRLASPPWCHSIGSMRIVPVLDLMAGQVVHGVGGRRHEYRPVVSRLTASCRPVDVAEAFRAHFGWSALYLADLDAIAGAPQDLGTCAALRKHGFRLWVDAGV